MGASASLTAAFTLHGRTQPAPETFPVHVTEISLPWIYRKNESPCCPSSFISAFKFHSLNTPSHRLHSLKFQRKGLPPLHKKAPFIFHERGYINFSNSPGSLINDDKILFPHILPPDTQISIFVPETYFQFVYFPAGQRL